jgi:hypothetical protein
MKLGLLPLEIGVQRRKLFVVFVELCASRSRSWRGPADSGLRHLQILLREVKSEPGYFAGNFLLECLVGLLATVGRQTENAFANDSD